jgi:uncharacterized membrane-anchored protein
MAKPEVIHGAVGKVAQVTVAFWIIKIVATTLGETGGDALTMKPVNLGYTTATYIFIGIFLLTVASQILSKRYHPALYWSVIISTTLLGTTTADWMTRNLLGTEEHAAYGMTALSLFVALVMVLVLWRVVTGSISVASTTTKKSEGFFWLAILVSNTLGTALGDWLADTNEFGFERGAMVFGGMLVVIGALYLYTKISRPILFWAAFILTRPLGATLGDILTKPQKQGGLDLSRPFISLAILALVFPLVAIWSRKSESAQDFEV